MSVTARAVVTAALQTAVSAIRFVRFALSVAPSSGSRNIERCPRHARVCVERVSVSSERADVYDLTVGGCHEFVAAGVVVHNCVWALTELMVDGGGNVLQYPSYDEGVEPVVRRGDLVLRGHHHIDRNPEELWEW